MKQVMSFFTERPHLAQLHRKGMGAVLVRAVIAEGGGRAAREHGMVRTPQAPRKRTLLLAVGRSWGRDRRQTSRGASREWRYADRSGNGACPSRQKRLTYCSRRMARMRSRLHSPPLAVGARRGGSCSLPPPSPLVHGGGVAKEEEHPVTNLELLCEQPGQQLVADLDGGGLVAVDAAGRTMSLCPGCPASEAGSRQITPVSPRSPGYRRSD